MKILNEPFVVRTAVTKLACFEYLSLHSIATPTYTVDQVIAKQWASDGYKVYCRTLLTSSSGKGVVIATNPSEVVNAPLYTKGISVDSEIRVHIGDGEVIDVSWKLRRRGVENNPDIRNHQNGWVFCRQGLELQDSVRDLALSAYNVLGLDFGAVDICVDTEGKAYILEVNTAPGITGTTLERYVDYFNRVKSTYEG